MPTYTYQCADCGHTYDAFHAMKDAAHSVCPACGGKVERLIGAGAGIVFKGSGFYVTDYRSGGKGSDSSAGEGGAAAPAASPAVPAAPAASSATKSEAPAPKSTDSKGGGSSSDS